MALTSPGGSWTPYTFERRALRPDDLAVRVTWCGVCHTDLHAAEALTADAPPGHFVALGPGTRSTPRSGCGSFRSRRNGCTAAAPSWTRTCG
ncbi:hypothetical protein TPA0908_61210 [Micromonospora sp. AKA38]|nr:hypothetical protein TPA0908_61210 [Micromonospora sp. AKA38]